MNGNTQAAAAAELDALLCFDLYAASRAVTAAYRPMLSELGLTYPQYLVLTVLWARESATIRELADTLRLDHATLAPLLRRMESAGLVDRARGTADERTVVVSATERGRSMHTHAHDIQCRMAEVLGISVADARQLQQALRAITSAASAASGAEARR